MQQLRPMKVNPFAASELATVVALLATMGELCVKILQRITQNEVQTVFPLSDQLRQIRADLGEFLSRKLASLQDFRPSTTLEARQLDQLRLGIRIVDKYDEVHATWSKLLADPFTDERRLSSADGWHALLEKSLPALWNRKLDLLALIGLPSDELVAAIQDRGFERVLVFSPPETSDPLSPSHSLLAAAVTDGTIRVAATVNEARKKYFPRDPPKRHAVVEVKVECEKTFATAVRNELTTLWLLSNVNRNTAKAFGPRWFNQGLENLGTLAECHHVSDLGPYFKDKPLLLVAPGPSLDRNIAELHRLQGKAIILAPAQSIRRLHEDSIYPEFIAVIDPRDYTAEPHPFFNPDLIKPHQKLIAGVTCHPNVLNLPYRSKYVFGSTPNAAWIDQIFGDPFISVGGTSVSVAMVNLALALGSNPIVLVGQDLSYSEGRRYARSHTASDAEGSTPSEPDRQPAKRRKPEITDPVFEVDGYFGGKVKTMYAYKAALYEMELIAEQCRNAGLPARLINATEGGANIKGFDNLALKLVIDSFSEKKAEETQTLHESEIDPHQGEGSRRLRGEKSLENQLETIIRLSELAKSCVELTKRLNKRTSQKMLNRLGKTEQKLRALLRPVNFLAMAIQEETEEILNDITSQSSLADNLAASLKFYDAILSACSVAEAKTSEALRRIETLKARPPTEDLEDAEVKLNAACATKTAPRVDQAQSKSLPPHSCGPAISPG